MKLNIEYYKMRNDNIQDVIIFVIDENLLHHREIITAEDLQFRRQQLYSEEKQYANAHIFVAMSQHNICGSIRIFQKTPAQILPIEKKFDIKIQNFASGEIPVYHIGRFAVSKGSDKKGFHIFKTLIALALRVAQKDFGGIVFAECDVKLLRTIRLLGIEAEAIGKPTLYMGSETVPIKLPWAGYQGFLEKNNYLLDRELPIFKKDYLI